MGCGTSRQTCVTVPAGDVEYLKNQQNEASSGFASAASTPDRGSKSHASVPSAVQDDQISRAEACDQGDKMEQDSDEAEEANYEALLLPGGCFPTSVSRFAVGVNYELLHGWVKQPSPCCAAASLAGAINALRGLKRQEKGAWGHRDVLYIMADILAAQADKLRESAERCLGAELTPLLNPLHQTLEKLELSLDKKDCTKKLILRVIRDITSEACEGHKQDPPAACFRLLRELMEAEHAKLDGEEECTAKNDESEEEGAEEEKNEDDHPQQTTDGGEGDEFPRKAVAMTFDFSSTDSVKKKGKGKKTLRGIKAGRQWEWGDALYKWLHKLGQVRKLTRDLPSTGPIGSWGILAAVERIDELGLARGVPRSGADADEGVRENAEVVRDDVGRAAIAGYKVRYLITRKGGRGLLTISKQDDASQVHEQWASLREKFNQPESVLIFHLTNHYALIYALREWVEPDGTHVRQVLTARRGQRPRVWMDWDEVRQIILKWGGYNIIRVTRT